MLVDFALGQLPQQAEGKVTSHLTECSECANELRRLKTLVECTEHARELSVNAQVCKSAKQAILETVESREMRQTSFRWYVYLDWRKMTRSPITKLAASVIILTVLIVLCTLDGTTSWAKVVEALSKVENVHINVRITSSNGQAEQQQDCWLKRPSYLRIEYGDVVIVDDGRQRLQIDKNAKTAQLGDSWAVYMPVEKNPVFELIGSFSSQDSRDFLGVEAAKLADESNKQTDIYEMSWNTQTGKAWIDTATMLPQRMVLRNQNQRLEIVFKYELIADDIFSTVIPKGYSELPYLEHIRLLGKVVDERGEPVAGAVVYADYFSARDYVLKDETDETGQFSIEVLPNQSGGVLFPIFLKSFIVGEPDRVAWMLLENPDEKRKLGGRIPGEPGQIQVVDKGRGKRCAGAVGIVLQMAEAGRITGKVTDNEGRPIADAMVSLSCGLSGDDGMSLYSSLSLGGSERWGLFTATKTDIDGMYVFENIPRFWDKCYFNISADKKGYVLMRDSSFTVECPLESKDLNLQMFKTGVRITGSVRSNLGEPLIGYFVTSVVVGRESGYGSGRPDQNGRFELTECPIVSDSTVRVKLLGSIRMADWDSNPLTKGREFVFYPDKEVDFGYEPGKLEYNDVEIVVDKPDIVLEVELKNTAGQPVSYFVVEVQSGSINHIWRREKLTVRTDTQGKCVIEGVPRVKELTLTFSSSARIKGETLTEEQRAVINENRKYKQTSVPVELKPGQKKYEIVVTLLTRGE